MPAAPAAPASTGFGDDESRAAEIRLAQAAFARQAAAGRPEAAQSLGPVRHARQRLAMVQRLVRRDLLQGEPEGGPARPGDGQDARAARRRLGLARREVPGGLSPQGVSRLLRRLLRRRQLWLPAGAEARAATSPAAVGRRPPSRHSDSRAEAPRSKPARAIRTPSSGKIDAGQAQGHDRLRQRSRRHHENLEHARQRQGREAAHQGRRTPTPTRASRPTASGSSTPRCAAAFPKSG